MQPGRPRDPDLDSAIRAAARHLLTEDGASFATLTMEAVAARAKAAKPSLYLRYPTKADLALSVITEDAGEFIPPDSEDLTQILNAVYGWAANAFGTPTARAGLPGVIAARACAHAQDRSMLTTELVPAYPQIIGMLEDKKDRGRIEAGIDIPLVLDTLLWAILFRAAILHQALDDDVRDQLVSITVRGLRSPA